MPCGILFALCTGIQWEWLPQELGFGSSMTCWRRLRDWNNAGVWQRLHEILRAAGSLAPAAAGGFPAPIGSATKHWVTHEHRT
ncbi:hypothetical protein GCM10010357_34400 [Streptomyces luteireticuli]|uniref:Insertion element IS402-like domain-containing protein n=1 Tax=Streptomyces luteireticuli TaxID=173858 RepID=A0ABP3IMA9_9ACTN